eukprot:gnl/TRDRNA2_/TRDRNA2_90847_c0_seq2.p1 gnl/TRDRNA2_/TRDRNA2_90847_c0~~gnl/TRDRNA2_/TRDRNA2_90847_c0_seq2.p1  ORF type:complete len:455 (-),score=73.61 gnl/TRDRNA2_/TRDRNA2_90847_c0_seq2:95-1402(-)
MTHRGLGLSVLLLVQHALVESMWMVEPEVPAQRRRRVISIGDLHGDFIQASEILYDLGLMHANGSWAGGNDVLVQTGDIVDRGDDALEIYETLFRLQDEAPGSGGEVILLLGNHELMNMQGDFRYTSAADTTKLGGSLANRTEAFGPNGWPGKQLRERGQVVARLGEAHGLEHPVIYAHAGILPVVAEAFERHQQGIGAEAAGEEAADAMNAAIRHLWQVKDGGSKELLADAGKVLLSEKGPLWTRTHALSPDTGTVCRELERSLGIFAAARLIVGHTSQPDGEVHHRCDGRLVLADTDISAAGTGEPHPSAVEVGPFGEAAAIYPRSDECLSVPLPKAEVLPVGDGAGWAPELRYRLAVLELPSDRGGILPSVNAVRRAYRQLARERHPDKGGTQAEFRELQVAPLQLESSLQSGASSLSTSDICQLHKVCLQT